MRQGGYQRLLYRDDAGKTLGGGGTGQEACGEDARRELSVESVFYRRWELGKYGMRKKHAVVRYHAEAVEVLGFGMIQKRWKCRGLVSCGNSRKCCRSGREEAEDGRKGLACRSRALGSGTADDKRKESDRAGGCGCI